MDYTLTISLRQDGSGSAESAQLTLPAGMPIEIGRVDAGAHDRERVLAPIQLPGCLRVPVAPADITGVSRRQVRIDLISADTARITNLSGSIDIACGGRPAVAPGTSVELALPVHVRIASVAVSLSMAENVEEGADELQSLESPVENSAGVVEAVKATLIRHPEPLCGNIRREGIRALPWSAKKIFASRPE